MPTKTRNRADATANTDFARTFAKNAGAAAGVDGCRAGWLFVKKASEDAPLQAGIAGSFADLLAGPLGDVAAALVDMPIGLAENGRRACERLARERLGPRRASVFAAPRRPMLAFDAYADANAWGKAAGPSAGGGLSKQAWNLAPKIREIDNALSPADQTRFGEGHPELAFTRLSGRPCAHGKKTAEGAAERRAALRRAGLVYTPLLKALRQDHPRRADFADDDFYDACVLLLAAQARLAGEAWRLSDDARDRKGFVMEIWG